MSIKPVLKMGEASLLEVSTIVDEIHSDEIDSLLVDMWDTMKNLNGAGLAAPQIGINRRVVIFGYDDNPRYPEAPASPLQ